MMARMMLAPLVIAAVMLTACVAATGGERGGARPAAETERVDLRMGERYFDPAGGLEIQPLLIEVNRATFGVRVGGITQEMTLTSGAFGTETIPPYTFELVSTTPQPSATLIITRVR